jgi:hypothetical protein
MNTINNLFAEKVDFGKTRHCEIIKTNDILCGFNLSITLPTLPKDTYWVNDIGFRILERVELTIGGDICDRLNSFQSKIIYLEENTISIHDNPTIGYFPTKDHAPTEFKTINVPLYLDKCHPDLSNHDVQINVSFARINELIVKNANGFPVSEQLVKLTTDLRCDQFNDLIVKVGDKYHIDSRLNNLHIKDAHIITNYKNKITSWLWVTVQEKKDYFSTVHGFTGKEEVCSNTGIIKLGLFGKTNKLYVMVRNVDTGAEMSLSNLMLTVYGCDVSNGQIINICSNNSENIYSISLDKRNKGMFKSVDKSIDLSHTSNKLHYTVIDYDSTQKYDIYVASKYFTHIMPLVIK